MTAPTKSSRIDLRVTATQKDLIEQAAAISGRTVTDFSAETLTREANEIIQRDRSLRVDAESFDAFNRILDRPAQSIDALAALFARPSVFSD